MASVSLRGCGAVRSLPFTLQAALEEKEFVVCTASCWCDLVGLRRMRLLWEARGG